MDAARFALVVPDDSELLSRLAETLATQGNPPISLTRASHAVVTFECDTADLMLRSRVVQALEAAIGPDWQRVAQPVG